MTDYVSKAQILERDDPRVTINDFEANRLASYEREEAALEAAADAVCKVWDAADQVAMLALNLAKVGHSAKRTDNKTIYSLQSLPATTLANWKLIGRYEINVTIESIDGLTEAFEEKLDADGTAEDSNKLGGKTLSVVETERDNAITAAIDNLIDAAPGTYDTLKEIADYIAADVAGAAAMTAAIAAKVATADIVNNLTTNDAAKPLSAAQGVAIDARLDDLETPTTGWGSPSGSVSRSTFNTTDFAEAGTGTLQDIAERLAALIADLKTKEILAD